MFKWSEVHFYPSTSYKIHTLLIMAASPKHSDWLWGSKSVTPHNCLSLLLQFFYWWNHFLQLHIVGLDCAIYKLGSIIFCKSKPELRNMVKTYLVKKALLLYSLAIASLATEVRGRKMVPNQSNKGRNMRSNPTVSQWARTISRVS